MVLIWFYYSSQIFLYGAEFTQVYSIQYGSEILPAEHAVVFVSQVQEEPPATEDAQEDEVDEAAGTIFRAPAWFMKLTGRIEAHFAPKDNSDSSEQGSVGKQ